MVRVRPGQIIRVQWLTFSLEHGSRAGVCEYDSVAVYDNTTVAGTGGLIGR